MGVTDVVPGLWTFAADVTYLCHTVFSWNDFGVLLEERQSIGKKHRQCKSYDM